MSLRLLGNTETEDLKTGYTGYARVMDFTGYNRVMDFTITYIMSYSLTVLFRGKSAESSIIG